MSINFKMTKTVKIRSFTDIDELAKQEIEKNIELKKRNLENNINILDARLDEIDQFFAGERQNQAKPIKP